MKTKCKGKTITSTGCYPCPCKVIDVQDHNPRCGTFREKCIALLECGEWEFVWNLCEENWKDVTDLNLLQYKGKLY